MKPTLCTEGESGVQSHQTHTVYMYNEVQSQESIGNVNYTVTPNLGTE